MIYVTFCLYHVPMSTQCVNENYQQIFFLALKKKKMCEGSFFQSEQKWRKDFLDMSLTSHEIPKANQFLFSPYAISRQLADMLLFFSTFNFTKYIEVPQFTQT